MYGESVHVPNLETSIGFVWSVGWRTNQHTDGQIFEKIQESLPPGRVTWIQTSLLICHWECALCVTYVGANQLILLADIFR